MGQVPQVAVPAVDGALRGGDGDVAFPGVLDGVLSGADVPFPPGRDDLEAGVQGHVGEFEAHLVVSLARGAVGHRVRALLVGDVHLMLGDEGPGDGRAQQVLALVGCAGAQQAEEVLLGEFVLQVLEDELARATLEGLFLQAFQFLALADVRGEANDLAPVVLLEPGHDDRSVQSSGVSQDHLFDLTLAWFSLGHVPNLLAFEMSK